MALPNRTAPAQDPPSYDDVQTYSSHGSSSASDLAAQWQQSQREYDLTLDYADLSQFYVRVSDSRERLGRSWRLLSLRHCLAPDRFYAAVLDTCELELPRELRQRLGGPSNGGDSKARKAPYLVRATYLHDCKEDVALEMRPGNRDDYRAIMTLMCRCVRDQIKMDLTPIVWEFKFFVFVQPDGP